MRRDKGFYFFLEGLEALPDYWASDIAVTIAAPITDDSAVHRLRAVAHRFRTVIVHNGFSHRTLDAVLKGVNLGIIPVLWEDNLPQVAIEFVSRGIPILTSDRGGAQEIGRNPDFVFQAGDREDFCRKLRQISTGRIPLGRFWDNEPQIVSMDQHVSDLIGHYECMSARPDFAEKGDDSPVPPAVVGTPS